MIAAELNEITEEHLKALIQNRQRESQTLDYKRQLPNADSDGHREFQSDICAFANASGGDLILGLTEDTEGAAQSITPLSVNPDSEQLRLQDLVLNGIEPRVTGFQVRAVPVSGGHIFVARVPRSWNGPHRVISSRHFYLREGARKRQLDMPEIKGAFERSSSFIDRIRQFRIDRISKALTNNGPMPLINGPISMIHILPVLALDGSVQIDPRIYSIQRSLPVMGSGVRSKMNFDGALQYSVAEKMCDAYTQLFRDGRVEALCVIGRFDSENGFYRIPSRTFEDSLINFYDRMIAELGTQGVSAPFIVFCSILRLEMARFGYSREDHFGTDGKFDRDAILLPEITIEESTAGAKALRPLFDLFWQSVDVGQSPYYDENGNRTNRR